MARRSYSNTAVVTTETGLTGTAGTTATLGSATGWPTTSGVGPFVACVEPGTPNAELILVGTRAGTALSAITRGYGGTAAVTHASGSVIAHEVDVVELDEANAHVNNTDPSAAHGPRQYVEAYLAADSNPGNSTAFTTLTPVVDAAVSMNGWTITGSPANRLTPPSGLTGDWKAHLTARFQTSTASAIGSHRGVHLLGVNTGLPRTVRLAVAQTHGHVANIEQDFGVTSQAFDISEFAYFQWELFASGTTGNAFFALPWTGPSAAWDTGGMHGTFVALEKG